MLSTLKMHASKVLIFPVIIAVLILGNNMASGQNERFPGLDKADEAFMRKLLNSPLAEREMLLKSSTSRLTPEIWQSLADHALHVYKLRGDFGQSFQVYLMALKVAELLDKDPLIARTYYHLGNLHSLHDFGKAVEYYTYSYNRFLRIKYWSDLIYVCGDLANLYYIKQELVKARAYADEAIKYGGMVQIDTPSTRLGPKEYGLALALVVKAYIAYQEGATINAIHYGKQAISLYHEINRQGRHIPYDFIEALLITGDSYMRVAEYTEAQKYYDRALGIAKESRQIIRIASVLDNLGALFLNQEEYEEALSYFEQARIIFEAAPALPETVRLHSNLYYNQGIVYQRLGQFPKALSSFSHCIEISAKAGSLNWTMAAMEGIGAVMRAQGRYAESLAALNKSEEIAIAINDREGLAETHMLKAKTCLAMRSFQEANSNIQTAAEIAASQQFIRLLYEIKTTQGEIYLAEGNREQAIKVLTEAIEGLESLREKIIGDEYARFRFLEKNSSPYHLLCGLMSEKKRGLDALFYAERAKSRVLYDAITERDARTMLRLTDEEVSEELSLRREIDRIKKEDKAELGQANDPPKNQKAKLDEAWLKYFSFKNRIISEKSAGGKYTSRPSMDRLRNLRRLSNYKDTLFLEYAVSGEEVRLFTITINPASYAPFVKIFRLPINSKDLSSKVMSFRRHLADRNPLFAEASRDLYNLLIKPVEGQLAGKKRICIIPDVFLWDLPFQALQNNARRYLIEEKPIFLAPSLSVLIEMNGQPSHLPKDFSVLALANPTFPESVSSKLSPLPEAEMEVKELDRLKLGQSRIAIGDSATESLLKAESSRFNVLHLATHGVLDNNNPLRSYLALAADKDKDKDKENEDGILDAYEIMNLNLNADLVVLSACETACGRIGPGEGVVGIYWAFFLAGCRSTVVSQWRVNSESTAQLMAKFYQNMVKSASTVKTDKSQALRRASIEILRDPRYSHPFYWASFVLVGNDN